MMGFPSRIQGLKHMEKGVHLSQTTGGLIHLGTERHDDDPTSRFLSAPTLVLRFATGLPVPMGSKPQVDKTGNDKAIKDVFSTRRHT